MPQNPKRAYSFQEGLAMMAAKNAGIDPYLAADAGEDVRAILSAIRRAEKAKGQDKSKHIANAQAALRKLNPKQHGKLLSAIQAKLLAVQGRGGDATVAHLEPGEMVIPRHILTSELAKRIMAEAIKHGIDPKRLMVGSRAASINPETGIEEFGVGFGGWMKERLEDLTGLPQKREDDAFRKSLELPKLPEFEVAPSWKERWGDTEPKVVMQRALNDFMNPSNMPEDRAAIDEAARRRYLNNAGAILDPKQLPDAHDLGMLQDINPDDLNRGLLAEKAAQTRWSNGKGYESDFQYVAPDNTIRLRSQNVGVNPNPASGMLGAFNKRVQYDRTEAGKRTLKDFPADMINPWPFQLPSRY